MNTLILNRAYQHPEDGWYHLEALGDHPNSAAGVTQVIDAVAAQSIVNRFNADAKAGALRHGHEMLIDHEHFSDQLDQESRAYGWLQELQNRADGIYGRIRWTTTGKAAVDGGDYRFFSTEYAPKDVAVLNKESRRVRPQRLGGLTLTNMPNNRGQKPITNRDPDFAASDEAVATETKTQKHSMKSIATKLGLAPEASEESVLEAVTTLMNRAKTAEDGLAPLKNRVPELEEQVKTLLGEQTDALLDAHGVKEEKVRNRLKPVLATCKNREDRVTTLADLGFPAGGKKEDKPAAGRIINRADSTAAAKEAPAKDDQELAVKITNRANQLRASGLKFETAWNQARVELAPTGSN